jgi:uncharacterized protein YegJ (DUF2314 family)
MAKKQSTTPKINYGPDTALIMGEGQVARSEAAKNMLPTMAFAEGFEKTFGAVFKEQQQEQEKRDAIREAAMIDLGGVQNINKLTEGYNKQQVTDFVRGKRDEYAKLSDLYQKTKDPNILDKMDAIKFSFQNLDQQLNGLVNERRGYLDAFDKGQVIDLPQDGIYTMAYTNNGQFEIGDNGDVGFNIDGKSSLLKDIAGKWNVKNNIYGAHAMQSYMNSVGRGEKNATFYPDIEKNKTLGILRQGGPEGIQTATKSDFDFDDDYKLPNGQPAGKMTFENMFKSGVLADKFYDGSLTGVVYGTKGKDGIWDTSKTGGSDWFWNNENSKDLSNLVAEFTTDVNQTGWNQGNANYKPKTPSDNQKATMRVNYGTGYIDRIEANSMFGDMRNKQENITSPDGTSYRFNKSKNQYEMISFDDDNNQTYIPVSNQYMLTKAGLWNQGYRMNNFDVETTDDDNASKIIDNALKANNSINTTPSIGRKV